MKPGAAGSTRLGPGSHSITHKSASIHQHQGSQPSPADQAVLDSAKAKGGADRAVRESERTGNSFRDQQAAERRSRRRHGGTRGDRRPDDGLPPGHDDD